MSAMPEREGAVEFDKGSMWENYPWAVEFNVKVSVYPDLPAQTICGHCHSPFVEVTARPNGSTFDSHYIICPRVVVARNEAGYSSTGVCLDCILEATANLPAVASMKEQNSE